MMAITYHPDIEVVAGMPVVISGVLLDATGQPLDITNAQLAWGLLDPNGNPVTPLSVSITKTDAVNGKIQIEIPPMPMPPGRYTDALQVTEGMNEELFWTGSILIAANPFSVNMEASD
jgi:hypothetical protein